MLIDITPSISSELPVWPGDTPATREVLLDIERGDSVTLSTIRATVHLGAHADAPLHYAMGGEDIAKRSLEYYLGLCQVLHVLVGNNSTIRPQDIPTAITAPRVLFATGTYRPEQPFGEDFASLSAELVDWLSAAGVITVGIDTPSVDPFSSKDLPAHHAIHRRNMAILEGLALTDVAPGNYELIALPLALTGFDGSPVRAVLRTLGD